MSSLDWLIPGRRVKGVSQSRGGDEVQPLPSSVVAWTDAEQVGRSVIQNVMREAGGAGAAPTAHCKIPTGKVKKKQRSNVAQIVWTYLECSSSKEF